MKFCKHCGKSLQIKTDKRKQFCDKSCAASHNNKNVRRYPKAIPRTANCIGCGESYFIQKNAFGMFCTRTCYKVYQSAENKRTWYAGRMNITRHSMRRYLIEDRGNCCEGSGCGVRGMWLEKGIVLEVDHIDGNNRNNAPTNVRLLCPNCHSQTPTYKNRTRI